jgi:hypothetical protein
MVGIVTTLDGQAIGPANPQAGFDQGFLAELCG